MAKRAKFFLVFVPDDEDDSAKSGAARVEDREVQQALSVRSDFGKLLDAFTETRPDAGSH
jgi:hypothetical protein